MKEFLQSRITFEDVIANTLSDWLTWVASVSAVSAAVVAIRLEILAAKWMQKRQSARLGAPAEEAAQDPFEQGAKQLVSLAFAKNAWLLRLWRWLEVLVAILWLGFANLLVRWIWWLPVVLLCYVGPAARHYGVGSLLQAPAKAIMTNDTASQVAGFLRTLILTCLCGGVYFSAFGDAYLFSIHSTVGASDSMLLNPALVDWSRSKFNAWDGNRLHQHWLFQWAPDGVSAIGLFDLARHSYLGLLGFYLLCLLCAVLSSCAPSLRARIRKRRVAEDVKRWAVKELLQSTRPQDFCTVHKSLRPVVGFSWPWRAGLWQGLALLVLDVGLDINTIVTLLVTKHHLFAAVISFLVARSVLKQLSALPPWRLREAIKDSLRTGLMRKDLLDFIEEEQRSEAFFCGCITAYSLLYSAQTADQLLVQFLSLLLSTWLFAGYAVRVCDLEFKLAPDDIPASEEAPRADTVGVRIDAIEEEEQSQAVQKQTVVLSQGLWFILQCMYDLAHGYVRTSESLSTQGLPAEQRPEHRSTEMPAVQLMRSPHAIASFGYVRSEKPTRTAELPGAPEPNLMGSESVEEPPAISTDMLDVGILVIDSAEAVDTKVRLVRQDLRMRSASLKLPLTIAEDRPVPAWSSEESSNPVDLESNLQACDQQAPWIAKPGAAGCPAQRSHGAPAQAIWVEKVFLVFEVVAVMAARSRCLNTAPPSARSGPPLVCDSALLGGARVTEVANFLVHFVASGVEILEGWISSVLKAWSFLGSGTAVNGTPLTLAARHWNRTEWNALGLGSSTSHQEVVRVLLISPPTSGLDLGSCRGCAASALSLRLRWTQEPREWNALGAHQEVVRLLLKEWRKAQPGGPRRGELAARNVRQACDQQVAGDDSTRHLLDECLGSVRFEAAFGVSPCTLTPEPYKP
ncbi:unnamed protein product [Symbiodinium natans]|uniref:Uncharacterized protein n=1 Tax=Symbiodinium natans TaxID=878477 RepID=A0A812RDD6_9DINO|nr:unnamed protein product [Symbiodinium natans]